MLTAEQREALRRDGYLVLPGAVPRPLVERALSAINQCLGRGLDPSRLDEYRSRSFCPELQDDSAIKDLLAKSGVWPAAESLLGEGRIKRPRTGQIALSFPTAGAPGRPHPHLDGMYTPTNGVPRGDVLSFSMLAGVMLSDVTAPLSGNLVVWPGTHVAYQDYFRRRGPKSLIEGMPDLPLGEPVAVTGRAGDAVLCHWQLAHAAGPNTSPHVRYAAYFRLEHVDHGRGRWERLTDIWRDWPGIGPRDDANAR